MSDSNAAFHYISCLVANSWPIKKQLNLPLCPLSLAPESPECASYQLLTDFQLSFLKWLSGLRRSWDVGEYLPQRILLHLEILSKGCLQPQTQVCLDSLCDEIHFVRHLPGIGAVFNLLINIIRVETHICWWNSLKPGTNYNFAQSNFNKIAFKKIRFSMVFTNFPAYVYQKPRLNKSEAGDTSTWLNPISSLLLFGIFVFRNLRAGNCEKTSKNMFRPRSSICLSLLRRFFHKMSYNIFYICMYKGYSSAAAWICLLNWNAIRTQRLAVHRRRKFQLLPRLLPQASLSKRNKKYQHFMLWQIKSGHNMPRRRDYNALEMVGWIALA